MAIHKVLSEAKLEVLSGCTYDDKRIKDIFKNRTWVIMGAHSMFCHLFKLILHVYSHKVYGGFAPGSFTCLMFLTHT